MQPLIGITCESDFNSKKMAEYKLRHNYGANLIAHGAATVHLPYDKSAIATYIKSFDGFVISGGDFDVLPSLYGAQSVHPKTSTEATRTEFEFSLVNEAIKNNIPLLGICGGAQLLAVALGGNLYQHIADDKPNSLQHEQPTPRNEPYHEVAVAANSMLATITTSKRLKVNSAHHQGIKDVGKAKVVATAEDGIIEALELPNCKFCLGIQWHPEYNTSPADKNIFQAFVSACGVS